MRNQEPDYGLDAVESTPGGPTVLVPEGDDWRLVQPGIRCCYRACGQPAVVELNRGTWRGGRHRPRWWRYCDEHSYSRVILADGIYYAYQPAWAKEEG